MIPIHLEMQQQLMQANVAQCIHFALTFYLLLFKIYVYLPCGAQGTYLSLCKQVLWSIQIFITFFGPIYSQTHLFKRNILRSVYLPGTLH